MEQRSGLLDFSIPASGGVGAKGVVDGEDVRMVREPVTAPCRRINQETPGRIMPHFSLNYGGKMIYADSMQVLVESAGRLAIEQERARCLALCEKAQRQFGVPPSLVYDIKHGVPAN